VYSEVELKSLVELDVFNRVLKSLVELDVISSDLKFPVELVVS
jgi:hypothetical protein